MRTSQFFMFAGIIVNQNDLDRLKDLRQYNKRNKVWKRICVKPRLGKNSPYRHLYNRISRQTIKWEHAVSFDVYARN